MSPRDLRPEPSVRASTPRAALPRIPLLLVLLLLSCDLGTPTLIDKKDSADADSADSEDSQDETADSTEDTGNAFDRDDDSDGWSENDGDCDDADPLVHPEATDNCNDQDDDCDGELDEDSRALDPYEPNDTDTEWAWIGSLEDADSLSIAAWLHNDQDLDRFSFYVDDPAWSQFGFTVTLSNIPPEANFQLSLGRLESDGSLSDLQVLFGQDTVSLEVSGEVASDDSGDFCIIIEALGGADCARSYLLSVAE